MQQTFLDLVREARDNGQSVFLSSHVLSEIQHVADSTAVLNRDALVTVARIDELRRSASRTVSARLAGADYAQAMFLGLLGIVILERSAALVIRLLVLALGAGIVLAIFSQWGAVTGRRSIAVGAAVAVAVLGYLLNAVGSLNPDNQALLDYSPYAWAFRHTPLADGWDWPGLALLYGSRVILLLIALLAISHRYIGR